MANYADYTYNSKNLLKRYAHRKRFKKSKESIRIREGMKLLDFGCGDALFLNQLISESKATVTLLGYEPFLECISGNTAQIETEWKKISVFVDRNGAFDYVTCFEVLEHFSEKKQREILEMILPILSDQGSLIVSVPIEFGFPSVIKNIIRRFSDKSKRHIYSFKNIKSSFFKHSIPALRQSNDYIFVHTGFYFQDLEKLFSSYYTIVKKTYSPLGFGGAGINSQVFYELRKNVL